MPISYEVTNDGHVIIAYATVPVSHEQFIQYEIDHAIDHRVHAPVNELFIIAANALNQINRADMESILNKRKEIPSLPSPHRCAIIVNSGDTHAWNLAKFYEGMVMLHAPESVIVFGEESIARTWLGLNN